MPNTLRYIMLIMCTFFFSLRPFVTVKVAASSKFQVDMCNKVLPLPPSTKTIWADDGSPDHSAPQKP
jgi:hypothetical protein